MNLALSFRFASLRRVLVAAGALAIGVCRGAGEPRITEGDDWSLPAGVKPAPYSGFYAMDTKVTDPRIKHAGLTLTWAHLNPADGVYDFSSLEDALRGAAVRGGMVLFRLKASIVDGLEVGTYGREREFMPKWVVEKHRPKLFHADPKKLYAAPWDPGVQEEFARLVAEIGRRGYLNSPQFLAIYLHGMSRSSGEEMNIRDPACIAEAKAAGMTPDVIMTCWERRMDKWAAAAGRNIGKVVWVGAGPLAGFDYPAKELDAYAEQRGLGLRGGFIEHYFYMHLHPPRAGQSWDGDYVAVDWSAPLRDGRYFGDEYETDEFPTAAPEVRELMARSSFFRAAQAGINFLWVGPTTLKLAGGVPQWYALVAGKGPAQSPDAACWLREAWVRRRSGVAAGAPWKNMERLLRQRDVEGARSVATDRREIPDDQAKERGRTAEFLARRTDVANGQRDLAFELDPVFRRSLAGPVEIKVTYYDHNHAAWTVRAAKPGGQMEELGIVRGRGDGAWRTATFAVEGVAPGALGPNVDFRVHVTDGGDVTVRYVRVVRTR